MAVSIRKALLSDAAEMAAVHIRSWEAAYAGIVPDQAIAEKNAARPTLWQKLLSEDTGSQKFAVCEDERIVGLMILDNSKDENEEEGTLEVGCLYMSPDFIGRGYGRRAMEFAAEYAKEKGYNKIILWVLEENLGARWFYEKCGYTYDGGKRELLIGKPLTALRYAMGL